MKPTAESHVRPIDEESPVEADSYPGEPVPIARRGRTVSEATTVRPTSPPTNMIAPSLHSRSSSMATAVVPPVDASEALRPDPGTESAFQVIDNPFAFSPGQLNKLLNPKSLDAFRALGGLRGIERGLQTNITSGLSVDETSAAHRISFETAVGDSQKSASKLPENRSSGSGSFSDRSRVFGSNVLPSKKATPLWKLMCNAYKEKVLIVLSVAAAISLALGLYETLGVEHPPGSPTPIDWVEGMAICIAIIIVVIVGGMMDWQKERAFVKLNATKEDREIKVIRSGKSYMINVADLMVGDVVHLEPGDVIPVDGIFIGGHDVKCDESSATGESDALKKTGGEQVLRMLEAGTKVKKLDPFIISGAKVLEGVGIFLCTSVGVNSSFGKIMMSIRTETEPTPLQKKLAVLAVRISQWAVTSASFLFFVLLFRFLANLGSDNRSPAEKASFFMEIFIVAITVIVVAVPEGLPLAVTLALAFATTKLLKENNLVRVLRSCETMGNATTICSDKTGTLTTNKMTVVTGTFGRAKFAKAESGEAGAQGVTQWASGLSQAAKTLIVQSVAINSTAFEGEEAGQFCFVGSKTETALLQLARDHLGMQSLGECRSNEQVVQMMPFDSSKKCMAAVIRLPGGGYRLVVKGASEILLGYCNTKTDVDSLAVSDLTATDNMTLRSTIETYARQSLRTIALVYRDHAQWPPAGTHADEDGHVQLSAVLRDLTFLGVVGIQDPVRPGVPEAVAKAKHAGVVVRMVTGDNAVTAQSIATECGIYTDGVIMEGPDFRTLSDDEMTRMLPRLQVLARSSPEDKRILVRKLKSLGETVAVTGDGTNDAPALKAADVGFSMGISGTEVAKEASQIILMDDNFSSIIVALKWGRAVNDSVQKFLQFQITVSITAVILAFVSAVSHPEMKSVLTAVQLLWVNLFMDTFAGIVLATDPPTDRILDRPPQGKSAPLITMNMWKLILGQTAFQLAVTVTLNFAGARILGYAPDDEHRSLQIDSMIFNTFVWMQIFNEFNCRRLDNGYNIFTGLQRNPYFVCINLFLVGCQVAIMFVGGPVFSLVRIDGVQWAVSVAIPLLSLPWAIAVRSFPDELFARIIGVVTWPIVTAYEGLCVVMRPIGRLMSRKKGKGGATGGVMGEENGSSSTVISGEKQRS
ncbi:plasma membrane calcium-transporting ATPase 2 [Plectosphaerella cucumerina]|uniref:Calcium-transporting ATPase n=1 Tax=Plectosphaerella cucumerina TaxID=40658 RepID=A0A8K0T7N7_9PEZI|nr:plasma membrane calcium-transporting ATPase 2 [Plectosphaerella cucumerina]